MQSMRWIGLTISAFFAGFFLVQYLVCSIPRMGLYAVLLVLALSVSIISLALFFRGREFLLAGGIVLAGFVTGYLSSNAVLLSQKEYRELPAVTRTDGGDGHTAVLYFTHGEPPGYSSLPWVETIREFDADHVPFIPWPFRPMFFNALRGEYIEVGGSAHNKLHKAFIDNLMRAMPEETAVGTRFYLAFLDSDPRPDEVVIRAINDGASRIVILPVFVTESTHTEAGKEMVASIEPEKYGIQTCMTGVLWDSESLQRSFVERSNEMLNGAEKSKVGILLVGHGQPTEWEDLYPAQNKQETQYREAIREKMIADGYSADSIIFAWMEYQTPGVTDAIKDLSARGVEQIFVFSVSLSADSIHSDADVPNAVEAANLPEETIVKFVGQYGDHPLAIQAMKEKIEQCK